MEGDIRARIKMLPENQRDIVSKTLFPSASSCPPATKHSTPSKRIIVGVQTPRQILPSNIARVANRKLVAMVLIPTTMIVGFGLYQENKRKQKARY